MVVWWGLSVKKRKNMKIFLECSEMFVYLQRGFVSVKLE